MSSRTGLLASSGGVLDLSSKMIPLRETEWRLLNLFVRQITVCHNCSCNISDYIKSCSFSSWFQLFEKSLKQRQQIPPGPRLLRLCLVSLPAPLQYQSWKISIQVHSKQWCIKQYREKWSRTSQATFKHPIFSKLSFQFYRKGGT